MTEEIDRIPPCVAFWLVIAMLTVWLVVFSQLGAISDGDEGLHLVGALLVRRGAKPYADFFYWHEPLYLYLVAGWMALWGDSWRSVHLMSALLTIGSTILVGTVVMRHFASTRWPAVAGIAAASFFALNVLVVKWGTMGHNYAVCLFLAVAAYRLALLAVDRGLLWAIWTGVCAGAATATSLLLVLVGPVLLWWIHRHNRSGNRRRKAITFLVGFCLPFLPLGVLAVQAPYQTYFGLIAHHLFYRGRTEHPIVLQIAVMLSWARSVQGVILVAGAALAIWHAAQHRRSKMRSLAEIDLCAIVAAAIALTSASIHPPAQAQYFVLVAPFLAVLASEGICVRAAADVASAGRAQSIVIILVGVFGIGFLHSAYREHLWANDWLRVEMYAAVVNDVTPMDASFYTAIPFVYFAARRCPPRGTENIWASRMAIPPESFARLHLLPQSEINQRLRAGQFDTVLIAERDGGRNSSLSSVYAGQRTLDRFAVLRWHRRLDRGKQ